MELNGALSNPFASHKALLERLSKLHRWLLEKAEITPREQGPAPPRTIPVLQTVTRVLEHAEQPMRAREIHASAQRMLGEPLRWSSVRAILSAYTIGGDRRFRRAGRGTYEVAKTE